MIPIYVKIPVMQQPLSSSVSLARGTMPAHALFLSTKFSSFSLSIPSKIPTDFKTIRMGGGPRTYPGGVSKWQWKRMQTKKAKQLLKARLARERQIYEMRKRAELKAAVSELERPWEAIEKAPTLFSSSADEHLKVLADRFQKPGGFDLWSERDGPQLFRPDNQLPSIRFFPKGVVHSVKPYGTIENMDAEVDEIGGLSSVEDSLTSMQSEGKSGGLRTGLIEGRSAIDFSGRNLEDTGEKNQSWKVTREGIGKMGIKRMPFTDSEVGFDRKNNRSNSRSDLIGRNLEDTVEKNRSWKVTREETGKMGVKRMSFNDSGGFDRKINRSNSRPDLIPEDSYSRFSDMNNLMSDSGEEVVQPSQGGKFTKGRISSRGYRRTPFNGEDVGLDRKSSRTNSRSVYRAEDSYTRVPYLNDFGSRTFEDSSQESLSGKSEGRSGRRGSGRKSLNDSHRHGFDKRIYRSNRSGYSAEDSYPIVHNRSDFGSRTSENVEQEGLAGKVRGGRILRRGSDRKSSSDSENGFDRNISRSKSRSKYGTEDSYPGVHSLSDFVSKTYKDISRETRSGKHMDGRTGNIRVGIKSLGNSKAGFNQKSDWNNHSSG